MTKVYESTIKLTGEEKSIAEIKKTITESIVYPFSTAREVYGVINGKKSAEELSEGLLKYRKAEFSLKAKDKPENSEIKALIENILAEYKLTGVKVEVTRKIAYKITLINLLVDERITYYAVYIDGDNYKVKTITVDPLKGEEFIFAGNKFKTKEEAESKLAEIKALFA